MKIIAYFQRYFLEYQMIVWQWKSLYKITPEVLSVIISILEQTVGVMRFLESNTIERVEDQ